MTEVLNVLIDKNDAFEAVRDQIGMILVNEVANQKVLATAAAKDPAEWDLSVYLERSRPWGAFKGADEGTPPIVNVSYQTGEFPGDQGDNMVQTHNAMFHVDVFAHEPTMNDLVGHKAGDEQAARSLHRAIRLVRNILMSPKNAHLQLTGTVFSRWIQTSQIYTPHEEDLVVQNVLGSTLFLEVKMQEKSVSDDFDTIEFVSVDVFRDSDGKLVAEADYDLT